MMLKFSQCLSIKYTLATPFNNAYMHAPYAEVGLVLFQVKVESSGELRTEQVNETVSSAMGTWLAGIVGRILDKL